MHHNPSSPWQPLILDVRRLARALWLSRPAACFKTTAGTTNKAPLRSSASLPVAPPLPPLKDAAVVAVAEGLPLTCAGVRAGGAAAAAAANATAGDSAPYSASSHSVLQAMSAASGKEWFRRTGARAPVRPRPPEPVCLVNEGALTRAHWAAVAALLPPCPSEGKSHTHKA